MEFVTSKRQFEQVEPSSYAEYIFECLNNPKQIWENEYSRRIMNIDRILLNTLYSLTNTVISMDVVRKCFEHRIKTIQGLDLSINHFEQAVKRMQGSMLKIVDDRGKEMLSVANPSVNDFMHIYLEKNMLEKEQIIEHSICYLQLARMLPNEIYEKKIGVAFEDESILGYVFENEKQKREYIVSYCTLNQICKEVYKPYFNEYILSSSNLLDYRRKFISFSHIYKMMIEKGMDSFYRLNDILCDISSLKKILSNLDLQEIVCFINQIDKLFYGEARNDYLEIATYAIKESIDIYCSNVPAKDYDVDVSDIIDSYRYTKNNVYLIDADAAADEIDRIVAESVLEDVCIILSELVGGICSIEKIMSNLPVSVEGSASMVEAYLMEDFPDHYYEEYREKEYEVPEIEYIFER